MSPAPPPALAFGVTAASDGPGGVVARTRSGVVDIAVLAARGAVADGPTRLWWSRPSLDGFLAAGRTAWEQVSEQLAALELAPDDPARLDETAVRLALPFAVSDYVDFYASEHHARNLGELLRPGQPALLPNWHHLPVGYHGRAGTVVVSGTPIRRPRGQVRVGDGPPSVAATARLDIEAEVGFVVGVPSTWGESVPVDRFRDHVFGVCLVNDWSARDIQTWEYQPLGPFLGKSFATSISGWVVPLAVLDAARVPAPSMSADLLPYLREDEPAGLDLTLQVEVNGEVLTRPPYASTFWSPAQMLAHLTSNGASLRTGDLFASGTVSGPDPTQVGSLFELWRGERFLADGDEVVITATAPDGSGGVLALGEVRGTVIPAPA